MKRWACRVLINEHAGFGGEGEATGEDGALDTLRDIAEGLRNVLQLAEMPVSIYAGT